LFLKKSKSNLKSTLPAISGGAGGGAA